MKKVVVASLLAFATSTLAGMPTAYGQDASSAPAAGQAAPAGQQGAAAGQITIKDPAEYTDYTNAVGQSAPAAKSQAIEAFLQKYPNTVVKKEMLEQLLATDTSLGDATKTMDVANRLLQVDPNNLRALAYIVYVEKQQAQGDKTKLDDAATKAKQGLAATKPADMSDADFQKLQAVATPIFQSAIAADATAGKDPQGAITAYLAELKSYTEPTQTQVGPGLVDTYMLGQAYLQLTPPDMVNGIWYLTRAAQFAPGQSKDQIEKAAEYWYNKYHGGMDGFDQIKTLAQTSVTPPDSYKPVAAPPPPSPADLAHQAVTNNPDLSKMGLSDKEFVLANGSPDDANKVWATLQGQTFAIPGKVVTATADSVQMAVSEDAQQSNKADFTINMKTPLKTVPTAGASVTYTATFDSFTQNPSMIVLKDGAPKTAAPAAHRPATRRR